MLFLLLCLLLLAGDTTITSAHARSTSRTTNNGGGGQRFRVTIQATTKFNGLGLRLVKLGDKVLILDIATGSPSEHAGGGLLKVGDAILAVGSTSVRPPKNTVKEVEKLILQHSQTSLTVDLIILKGWQAAEAASAASNSGGGDPGGGDPGGEEAAKGKNRAGASSSSSDDGGQGAREREQQKRRDNSKTTTRTTRISPQQTWRYQTSLERNITSGFGLQLRKKNQLVIIDAVQKNTPAWRTHLLSPEDKIEVRARSFFFLFFSKIYIQGVNVSRSITHLCFLPFFFLLLFSHLLFSGNQWQVCIFNDLRSSDLIIKI